VFPVGLGGTLIDSFYLSIILQKSELNQTPAFDIFVRTEDHFQFRSYDVPCHLRPGVIRPSLEV